MKKHLLLFFLIINTFNLAMADDFYNVKYLYNYDGDTIKFDLCRNYPNVFRYISLRLYGIDTPEIKTKAKSEKKVAIRAKNFVKKELTKANVINLKGCKKDKYFRLLCTVEYDGKDLTTELLKRKYGCEYYGGKKQNFNNCK